MTTAKKTASRYIIVKMLKAKDKENILEALRKPLIIHKTKQNKTKKQQPKANFSSKQ